MWYASSFAGLGLGQRYRALTDTQHSPLTTHHTRWRVVKSLSAHLPAAFVNDDFEFFSKALSGTKELKPVCCAAIFSLIFSFSFRIEVKALINSHYPY